ncbi:hypothetical protein [Nitrosomonas halophila]|uniref:Integrase n=1 Tax=Nitrosomonas halophila TaxID=44576 RepID=A0A1H3ITN4_9PROT|nr:hypothetical protein [Nitrosomonas halophila]SDY30695.1 hypothetical protein SAMN05421881_102825 [Nitrosomonas halophila]
MLRNLKPRDKPYKVNDRNGLYVAANACRFRFIHARRGQVQSHELLFSQTVVPTFPSLS